MSKPRILVTGACGFIGSHLAEALVRAGYPVRALVYYNSFNSHGWLDDSPADAREALDIRSGDIRDPDGVREVVKGCDVVLHLAALISIPFSYHSPAAYVDTNVTGTLNVLQAARDFDLEGVVCTSTSEVYGTAQFVPITEDHPLVGQSPYAATKIGADQMALAFHRSFEMPVAVIRPFNTFGPRQSARAVIPTVITQLLSGRRKLRLGSLHPTRDFTYVADLCRAYELMIGCDDAIGRVTNVGSNFEVSIGQVAETIADIVGADIEIETDDIRVRPELSEVDRLWADNSAARERLGWAPSRTGLDGFREGLEQCVEWFRRPGALERYKPDIYNI